MVLIKNVNLRAFSFSVIELDHSEFTLPSKTSKPLRVTMTTRRRAIYQCNISYQLVAKTNGIGKNKNNSGCAIRRRLHEDEVNSAVKFQGSAKFHVCGHRNANKCLLEIR